MDGKEYFGHFMEYKLSDSNFNNEHALHAGESLADKLFLLYGVDQIYVINSTNGDERPLAVEMAERTCENFRFLGRVIAYTGADISIDYQPVREDRNGDREHGFDEERDPEVVQHCDVLDGRLSVYGDKVLSECLDQINKSGKKIDGPNKVSEIVKNSLGENRNYLAELIQKAGWHKVLSKSHELDSTKTKQERVKSLQTLRDNGFDFGISEIDPNEGRFPYSVDLVCSKLLELDALIALNNWVTYRNLPYLPVFAPKQYETGKFNRDAGNPHADLFLCNLTPGHNDIIPIQVKQKGGRYGYIPQMQIIHPGVLRTEEITDSVVTDDEGRRFKDRRYTITFGGMVDANLDHQLKKKTSAKKELNIQLGAVYPVLDGMFGPGINSAAGTSLVPGVVSSSTLPKPS